MWGISWGGFNALQVAALRPPELKAIISVASTVDRYAADVHYNGGCVLGSEMVGWATSMLSRTALPPTPRIVGDGWKRAWLDRLEATPPFIGEWLPHQTRDGFGQHGSVCEDYAAITVPSLVVAGFADGYSNAPFYAVQGMPERAWGLVGPWAHNYPDFGEPGPNIGFLQHALRWWDHWLKGADNGIEGEPHLRIWMQDSVVPADHYLEQPGRWVAEETWSPPPGRITEESLYLDDNRLDPDPGQGKIDCATSQLHGLVVGEWWGVGEPGTLPGDQRIEDERSLTFTGDAVTQVQEICGFPKLDLRIRADRPDALVAVRLCDVAPDGSSLLVTKAQLNLTHRKYHEKPEPVVRGERFDVTIRLDAAAHSLPAGHRWRLAVATTNWPLAWPSPVPAVVSIELGEASRLRLPVRAPRVQDAALPEFSAAEFGPADRVTVREPSAERSITTDGSGATVLRHSSDGGRQIVDRHGTVYDSKSVDVYSIREADPLAATARATRTVELAWGDKSTRVAADAIMRADLDTWYVDARLKAWHRDELIFDKTWDFSTDRILV